MPALRKDSLLNLVLCMAGAVLAIYTQLTHLTAVPGLHFDEAWQGLFAHDLAQGNLPQGFTAMNSYTSPVLHGLLAVAFKLFGPELSTLRGTFAAMNLFSMTLIAGLLWKTFDRRAAAWFILLWALLPLSVHDHRFYVEMTGFFGFCFALVLAGLSLWRKRPRLSFALVLLPFLAASYSHILFVTVLFGGVLVLLPSYPHEFQSRRGRALIMVSSLFLIPLGVRMGLGLARVLPFLLALGLAGLAFWAGALRCRAPLLLTRKLAIWILLPTAPFLFVYVALLWNGFWAYANVTGYLNPLWLPVNAFLFLGLMFLQLSKKPAPAPRGLSPDLVWAAFSVVFFLTTIMILKQSARYYMVPTLLALVWSALRLARLRSGALQGAVALGFIAWNLWAFESSYLRRFERFGATNEEFRLWIFHDTGRDFRPFQKIFAWAEERGCAREVEWVEDDRFLRPIQFLQLTARPPRKPCPWTRHQLHLSHLPGYRSGAPSPAAGSDPTPPVANVKFLAHDPEWGDLSFWLRR